ncbi:MAG: hypothetical protein LBD42_05710 [Desulfovibrio sp.]|jgi:hypothetical protein|nr:hypothetical protein [Desulfovibrio sp.]
MSNTGVSLDSLLSRGVSKANDMASNVDAKVKALASGKEMKQEDLLIMNYDLGQYQAYMTMLNNTLQSILQQVKELAKSIH